MNKELKVSDHAIVRYIERIMNRSGLIKDIRRRILGEQVLDIIDVIGEGEVPNKEINGEEYLVRIKNGIVVTIFKKGE